MKITHINNTPTTNEEWDEMDDEEQWETFRIIEARVIRLEQTTKDLINALAKAEQNKRYGWDAARESGNALVKVVQERNATIATLEGVAAHRDSLMMECASLQKTADSGGSAAVPCSPLPWRREQPDKPGWWIVQQSLTGELHAIHFTEEQLLHLSLFDTRWWAGPLETPPLPGGSGNKEYLELAAKAAHAKREP